MRYINSFINSGTAYTAPADGYIYIQGTGQASVGYKIEITDPNDLRAFWDAAVETGYQYKSLMVSVRKGDAYNLIASAWPTLRAMFFYAQGEVPNS